MQHGMLRGGAKSEHSHSAVELTKVHWSCGGEGAKSVTGYTFNRLNIRLSESEYLPIQRYWTHE